MKTLVKIATVASIAIATLMGTSSCSNSYKAKAKIVTTADSISYALGTMHGGSVRQVFSSPFELDTMKVLDLYMGSKLNPMLLTAVQKELLGNQEFNEKAYKAGFAHKALGEQTQITEAVAQFILQTASQERAKLLPEENLAAGQAFLAENAKKAGINILDNGIQYKVNASGDGESPTIDDNVMCHYEGRLINGDVFDSSIKRGQPATFPLNGVIKGWTEVLQHMKVGDKWTVYIPSELAYGERGAGRNIGPNETLIFDIELIKVIKAEKAEETEEAEK